ncbi:MAG: AlpA family transcriptional regulator [Gammaproteobacteria bacterium]|nr:AlpA family transcriptional regulator [Gammaproteobacteria bacterium]
MNIAATAAAPTTDAPPRFLRLPEVVRITGLSKATIYRQVKAGEFPGQRKIGARASAWLSSEVDAWMAARLAA